MCVGLGTSAAVLAADLAPKGWRITGSARSDAALKKIEALGFAAVPFDGSKPSPDLAAAIAGTTHLLVSAPPDMGGDPLLRWHAPDLGRAEDLSWIGYLSTVGVYGDHDGRWVDETTPIHPQSDRSRARAEAEAAWLRLGEASGKTVQVYRLSGIYGPGQNAFLNLKAGEARRIVKPGQVFNRIHVADIAGAVAAAMTRPPGHLILNVTDNEPAPPQDVVAYAAALLGRDPPPEIAVEDAKLSPMARSFYSENKRVSNRRLREVIGYRLRYPTYREGLTALYEEYHAQTKRQS